jgi:E3 ubiquitin-protein ligase HUWE1
MQQTIKRYFALHRARPIGVDTYVRNCSAIALRDMDIFIESTKSLCQMGQPFSSSPFISLRAESLIEAKAPQSDVEPSMDMQVDVPAIILSNTPQKSVESVIQLLIVELMNTVKVINDTPDLAGNISNVGTVQSETLLTERMQSDLPIRSNDKVDSTSSPPIDVHDKYQYLCFTMQCLTELLFSYDTCKVAFLSYSKKRSQQGHSKDQANKFRTTTLHFLLSDLITYGTISPSSDGKHRNKGLLCSWAMNVVGALCVDTSSAEMKDVSADLTNVRKFVLETISRAIKDLPPTESTEARYGRLLALADLCHRLLTVRMNLGSRKQQDEVPTHMAKIMLEKNFVAILTTALSEIDLNYPNVRNLVAAMLRPLEHL